MKRELRSRDRELLSVALNVYEALAKSVKSNLESLNLPTMAVDTALGNVEVIRKRLGTTSSEVEIQEDLRITARDALDFMYNKAEAVKKSAQKLTMATDNAEEFEHEVSRLTSAFSEQMVFEGV